MKIGVIIFFAIALFLISSANSCERKQGAKREIKTASYWTSPIMSQEQARELSLFDLVIVDMENQFNNKKALRLMKRLNPSIKLICYSNPMEFYAPAVPDRLIQKKWLQESQSYPGWFLRRGDNSNAVFWPGMTMMNISSLCPVYDGKNYSQWLVEKLLTEVLSDPIWDGYFFDNGGGNISWLYENSSSQLDIDNDGFADGASKIDQAWYEGIHFFLSEIRRVKGNDFIILANKGSVEMMDVLDGRFFEAWVNDYLGSKKNGGWNQCLENAQKMELEHNAKYIIFQVKSSLELEFALASAALLNNVYVAVGQDNWRSYPVFDLSPGKAMGDFWESQGIFYRNYEKGKVVVDPFNKSGKFIQK